MPIQWHREFFQLPCEVRFQFPLGQLDNTVAGHFAFDWLWPIRKANAAQPVFAGL